MSLASQKTFSIIIPVKEINEYVRENVHHIKNLNGNNWDLTIVTNDFEDNEWNDERIEIISSGKVSPARKRDLAARKASGRFLVFLDDDSYPEKNFLINAISYFSSTNVVAIGGPAITPDCNSLSQRVSGAVFISKYSGGFPERYVSMGKSKAVDDWPSVNLIVRKKQFLSVGGFDSDFWPGEDTLFCRKILSKSKMTLLYAPNVIVWHHRRSGLIKHLIQIGAYGRHRGYFFRVFPENSRKLVFAVPSVFFLFLLLTIFWGLLPHYFQYILIFGWSCYIICVLRACRDVFLYEGLLVATMVIPYIFLTHVWYGVQFIIGLGSRNLMSKLR
jgi:cellulose synthase/poly-beta-1,6-N-acetylglucosamine synthase-like glycosyltransferase